MNIDTLNFCEGIFVLTSIFHSLRWIPRCGLIWSLGNVFRYRGKVKIPKGAALFYNPYKQSTWISISPVLAANYYCLTFIMLSSRLCEGVAHCGLDWDFHNASICVFSGAYWPFVYLFWQNVQPCSLPI